MPYIGSYVWKVRQKFGHDLLLLPAASVIVERKDGAILMLKRADTGKWCIPGGYAEEGASFQETALAELQEEAAIRAQQNALIPCAVLSDPQKMHMEYPNGDKTQVFLHVFIVREWQELQQAVDEAEITDQRFFHPEEITADMLHSATQEEISAYRDYVATGEFQSR